jgi:SPP1 family predicted phage head-tail adaptor
VPYNDSRLDTGKMRHRIQVVSPGNQYDETGGISLACTSPLTVCWARIEAISGRDTLAAQQFSSVATHKITTRFDSRFSAKDQVYFQGPGGTNRVFQIEAVLNPDERNKMLVLLVVEVNDSAQQVTNQPGGLS